MDALILAAGYGMRMDNLTKDIPKPLLKIKNKTLISYAIDLIKNMSFDKIYINPVIYAWKIINYLLTNRSIFFFIYTLC